MKRFYGRIAVCLIPLLVGGYILGRAVAFGQFRLGVDLVGGTILVYEVEHPGKLPADYRPEEMAAALKRRIDPADLYNVVIRPIGTTRVEIVLPTGGAANRGTSSRRNATAEYVEHVKSLIAQVGSLEFRVLANDRDDAAAIKTAERYLADPAHLPVLEALGRAGEPPPPPPPPDGRSFATPKGHFTYAWVQLGPQVNSDNYRSPRTTTIFPH